MKKPDAHAKSHAWHFRTNSEKQKAEGRKQKAENNESFYCLLLSAFCLLFSPIGLFRRYLFGHALAGCLREMDG